MKQYCRMVPTIEVITEGSLLTYKALLLKQGTSYAVVLLQDRITVATLNKETNEWMIVPDTNEVLLDLCHLNLGD